MGVRIECAAARHAAACRIEQKSYFVMVAARQPLEQNSVLLVQFGTPFRRTSIHNIGGNMMLRRSRAAAHHFMPHPWVGGWAYGCGIQSIEKPPSICQAACETFIRRVLPHHLMLYR